jgi:hypothetical protein
MATTVSLSDLLFDLKNNTQKNLTASLASWLINYYNNKLQWNSEDELNMLSSSVELLLKSYCEENSLLSTTNIEDPRIKSNDLIDYEEAHIFKVYTDYDLAKDIIKLPEKIVFVDNISEADFLFVSGYRSLLLSILLY